MVAPSSVLAVIRAARPRLSSEQDRVVFALHAAFLSLGYRLVATGADVDVETTDEAEEVDAGLEGWNEGEGSYAFRYAGDQGLHKRLVVKCLAVGDTLLVDVVPIPAPQLSGPVHCEIRVGAYAAPAASPNYAQQYTNLEGLLDKLNTDILEPLKPSGPLGGGREARPERSAEPAREPPMADRPYPYPSREGGYRGPPGVPLGIGSGDLLPGGGGGIFPPGPGGMGGGGGGGGGGMMLGPNDPYWGQVRGPGVPPGGLPPGVPPGARFDPFGPPGVPGFEPERFIRGGRRPPGGPPTHPDLEQFRSPED